MVEFLFLNQDHIARTLCETLKEQLLFLYVGFMETEARVN